MINICFHGIGTPNRKLEQDEEGYWISRDLYHRIIDEIQGRDDVEVSFDDGNASDIEIGLGPLLNSGRKGAFYVLAARLDQPGSLSSGHIRQLREQGMLIGSHGMDHVPWRHLTAAQEHREFTEARAKIADVIGEPIKQAALPLGRYDRRVLTALRRLGYDHVYSSDRRRANPQAWLQPRYSVHANDTIETIRAEILAPPRMSATLVSSIKGAIKRLR